MNFYEFVWTFWTSIDLKKSTMTDKNYIFYWLPMIGPSLLAVKSGENPSPIAEKTTFPANVLILL